MFPVIYKLLHKMFQKGEKYSYENKFFKVKKLTF